MENKSLVNNKDCFKGIVPREDARSSIKPLDFVVALVFTFLGARMLT